MKSETSNPLTLAHWLALTLAGVLILVCSGCSTIRQQADSSETDPKTGNVDTRRTSSDITTFFNAKQVMGKVNASNGKTHRVGASEVAQEASMADILKIMLEAFLATQTGGAIRMMPAAQPNIIINVTPNTVNTNDPNFSP